MRAAFVRSVVSAMLLAAGGSILAAADDGPITFAVLRADGILVPVATRIGQRWTSPWPEPTRKPTIPLSLEHVPKRWWGKDPPAPTWHAWLADGTRTAATVTGPAWYPTYCLSGVGLQTNVVARRPLPRPATSPYPKLGLAASAPAAFARIDALDDQAEVWTALRARLRTAFVQAEQAIRRRAARVEVAADVERTSGGSIVAAAAAPAARRARIERVYRAPLGPGRFVHYFEAVRRYPDAAIEPSNALEAAFAHDRCHGMVFASGWFVSDGTTIPEDLTIDVASVPCSYDGVRTMLPLGYIVEGDTTWWFAQFTERSRESYGVLRATAGRPAPEIVLTAKGGSCSPAPAREPTETDWPPRALEGLADW